MPLCDTLLRFAEEPAFYRIAWSTHILDEVRRGLSGPKFGYTETQTSRRMDAMQQAFPEACCNFPEELLDGIIGLPDLDDRHVVAAAIASHSLAIVTANLQHFPQDVLHKYGLLPQSPDDFLTHQFHLNPGLAREKIDAQAAALKMRPEELLKTYLRFAPSFVRGFQDT
jgi:hypothetical protein